MSAEFEEPTVEMTDPDTGEQVIKELDKAVLSKGAWQTMMFLCQERNAKTGEFGWVRSDRIVADNTSDEQPVFVTAPKNGEWLDNTEERIVNPFVGDYIYLRYHPVEDSDRICNIYKGEVVTLLAQHEDYSLVMTQSGATGWVLTDRLIKR